MVSVGLLGLHQRPHVLYRFYDRTDTLLYVGITMDLPKRMGNHRKEKPWWAAVDHITVEHFDNREDALAAEAEAIRTESPLYNVSHNDLVQAPHLALEPSCGEECGDDCRHHHHRRTCVLRDDLALRVIDEIRERLGDDEARFERARATAEAEAAAPYDVSAYPGDDVVPIVAQLMVGRVVDYAWRFRFVFEELLGSLDPALRDTLTAAAEHDWICAGLDFSRLDLMPDILRHLGYHLTRQES